MLVRRTTGHLPVYFFFLQVRDEILKIVLGVSSGEPMFKKMKCHATGKLKEKINLSEKL